MATIHLITVADLADSRIGETCAIDLKRVRELVAEAASQAGMDLQCTGVVNENFDAEHITSGVRHVSPGWDDTVVFYYSGHGARGESKRDAWPVMSLGSTAPPFDAFDLAWVYQTLHEKRARMLLMFVDCCQQLLPDTMLRERSTGIRGAFDAHSAANFRLLFRSFAGEVLLMSCKPGQYSGCNSERGGFFTWTFLDALRSSVVTVRDLTWDAVAKSGSLPPTPDQEPIWKVVDPTQCVGAQAPGMEPFPGNWQLGQVMEREESGVLERGQKTASPSPANALEAMLRQSEDRIARARQESESRLARLRDRLK